MIYVLLADGFEDIEALEPIDILRRSDLAVQTVGINSKTVTSSHGIQVIADIELKDLNKENMTMLVLPGGPGHVNLDSSLDVHELIDFAVLNKIYIAAICASPSIIGKKGILNGKKYTCFPGFENMCTGGTYLSDKAVLDGKILTGKGAGAASDFGFKMVEIFKGYDFAMQLKSQMQY